MYEEAERLFLWYINQHLSENWQASVPCFTKPLNVRRNYLMQLLKPTKWKVLQAILQVPLIFHITSKVRVLLFHSQFSLSTGGLYCKPWPDQTGSNFFECAVQRFAGLSFFEVLPFSQPKVRFLFEKIVIISVDNSKRLYYICHHKDWQWKNFEEKKFIQNFVAEPTIISLYQKSAWKANGSGSLDSKKAKI